MFNAVGMGFGRRGSPVVDLTQGQVAHYLLTNNADDSYGTYDGTPSGGIDFQGDVASFDGVDDKIDVSSALFDVGSGARTYNVWIKGASDSILDTENAYIASCGLTGNNHVLVLGASTVYLEGDGSQTTDHLTGYVTSDTMQMLTIIIDIAQLKITTYIDGASKVETTIPSDNTTLSPTAYPSIGVYIDFGLFSGASYYGYFDGDMSNFRIYNEAKDQTFIDALYAEGYYPKPLPLPTTDGLVAHYPLTGTAEDTTGNYDGTENGGLTYIDDAEFGSVASFDGIDDAITISSAKTNQQGAVSFWFKVADANAVNVLWSYSDISDSDYIYCRVYLGKLNLLQGKPSGLGSQYIAQTSLTISNNIWYHAVIQADGTNIPKVFIDETEYALGLVAGALTSDWFGDIVGGDTFNIGLLQISTGTYYDGAKNIRKLREYNSILTQQEITDIYNYEKNFRPIDIDDGLVAYYPLANNSLDNYKNQYDGVDTAMTYDGLSGVFNGSTSYVAVTKNAIPIGAKTITFWMKRTASGLIQIMLCTNGTTTSKHGIDIRLNTDNTIGFSSTYASAGNHRFIMSHPLVTTLNQWHFISCRWDGTTNVNGVQLRIDASIVYSTATLTESVTSTDDLYIGTSSVLSAHFSGYKSYIRSVNKALTDEQIDVIYNTEKGDFGL